MRSEEYQYVLVGRAGSLRGEIPVNFKILNPSDNIVLANSIADCLNAERNGADAVIWNSNDLEQLEELAPRNSEYGWMLVSINIPILFNISSVDQLETLENIKVDGFYSDDLSVLKEIQKKIESLPSE